MKSSKTANLLMSYHNYLEKGIDPILVKPETDNRSGHTMIKSRVGIKEKADYVVVNGKHNNEILEGDRKGYYLGVEPVTHFSSYYYSAFANEGYAYIYPEDLIKKFNPHLASR